MIVVDTHIIACMTFATRFSSTVSALHEKDSAWEAPPLWKSEFLKILSTYYRKGFIDYQDSLHALGFAERLIGPREHNVSPKAVIDIVVRSSSSSYDCEFIALAEKLGTRLVTYDKKLVDEFPGIALTPEAYLALSK